MIQFYFLSILFNALTGYILAMEAEGSEDSKDAGNGPGLSLRNSTFRLVLGGLTMAAGILKVLSAFQGDIPVLGDIVPAIAGLAGGFILVFEYYDSHSALNTEKSEKLALFLGHNKRWIGFGSIASAALHFLFPSVLFL
jgi:hypothetical protein